MDSTRAESREVTPQLAAEVMTAEETYTMHLRLYRGLVAECLDWVPVELPFEGREAKAILDPGVDKLILYPRQERLRFQLNHLAGIRTEAHLRLEDLHAGAKFIRIETAKRIDIRGIILAAELPVVCFGTTAEMFPESMLVATHKIGRCTNEKGRGLRRHSLPWGGAGPESGKFDEASTGCTSPYIIHVEDLERFSMGLMGGDNAYIRFAKCTKHTITFHDAGFQAKYPDLAEWSCNKILREYSKRLVGFDRFRVLHRGSTIQLDEVARQPVLDRDFISGHLAGRLSEGRRLSCLNEDDKAADAFIRGVRQIVSWDDEQLLQQGVEGTVANEIQKDVVKYYFQFFRLAARACLSACEEEIRERNYAQRITICKSRIERARDYLGRARGVMFGDRWTDFEDVMGSCEEIHCLETQADALSCYFGWHERLFGDHEF